MTGNDDAKRYGWCGMGRYRRQVSARLVAWSILLVVVALTVHPVTVAAANGTRIASSRNWAGYMAEAKDVTLIHAAWKVPVVARVSGDAFSSSWVGIGGTNSETLIQAGTTQYIENGTPQYYAWIETLPQTAELIPSQKLRVRPGDAVGVTIRNTGGDQWQIKIENASAGQQLTRSVTYASCKCSAEWIEEEPTIITESGQGLATLADFGSVKFSDAYAKVGGTTQTLRQLSVTPITLKNSGGQVLATTGELSSSGNTFTVKYGS